MGPKKVDKKSEKGQQKALEKQQIKVAEDKTFGLKNKNKSKTVQKYIKGVQNAAKGNNISEQAQKQKEIAQKEEKKKEAQQAALLASLFKGAENIKNLSDAKNVDPQSIKESQQIDIYTDRREESMDDWDDAKLAEVIKTKHGASTAKPTEIVCRFFLDALEKRQYGWFWSCPNGGDSCKYRHCLPPGYVLKRDVIKDDEEDDEQLEEIIERQRAELKEEGVKVTLETFLIWKAKKEQERKDAVETARLAEQKKSGGRGITALSGRDLFSFDPSLFVDDVEAAGEDDYQEDEDYWNTVLQENQDEVDRSNREALNNRSDGNDCNEEKEGEQENNNNSNQENQSENSSSSSSDKPRQNIVIHREDLFLEGEVPDLDELDA